MRIAIVGAGAIGGMITALLAEAGADPLLVARGKTLATLQEHGMTFVEGDHRAETRPRVVSETALEGPQDLVIIAVKAHQIESALPSIMPLVGPNTLVMTAINGVPWWFFQGFGGDLNGTLLRQVDPTGLLSSRFRPTQIVGCAVYLAAEVHAPFTIESAGVRRLEVGMAAGPIPDALRSVAALFEDAGLPMPIKENIRTEVLNKLMGNIWANPVSVITGATVVDMTDDAGIMDLARKQLTEFQSLCEALDITLPLPIEKRLQGAARLGAFRSSMLQDIDRGRAIELEAILGAAIEIADLLGTPSETMRMIHALTRSRALVEGCYAPHPDLPDLAKGAPIRLPESEPV